MMTDARHGRFNVVLVWASDRIARSVKHYLDVLDELNRIGVEYVSFRENIDTGGPLGRAVVTIIGVVAELERSLIIERVRAGMRRARPEGQHIGRNPLELDHAGIQRDRELLRAGKPPPSQLLCPSPDMPPPGLSGLPLSILAQPDVVPGSVGMDGCLVCWIKEMMFCLAWGD